LREVLDRERRLLERITHLERDDRSALALARGSLQRAEDDMRDACEGVISQPDRAALRDILEKFREYRDAWNVWRDEEQRRLVNAYGPSKPTPAIASHEWVLREVQ
jgi:hypothetical protein